MRCDQPMGLPPAAEKFLQANLPLPDVCPTCGNITATNLLPKRIGVYFGMFENEYPLHCYTLADGREVEEFHQVTEWSSGPMLFLGLRVGDTIFEWSDEEIAACL